MKKKDIIQREVISVIRMVGSQRELDRIRKLVSDNALGFDFDSVIRPPAELNKIPVSEDISLNEEINYLTTYGACDILEWRRLNWGTEWTNLGTSWYNNGYMKMKTVNTPAIGIFRNLTLMFKVKLYVTYANYDIAGVLKIEKGKCTSETLENEEAEIARLLIEDMDCNYTTWESSHKKAGKSKKLEMELLFNYDTPFLSKVKQIIDPATQKVKI